MVTNGLSDYVEIYASIYTQGGPSGTLQFRETIIKILVLWNRTTS